MSIQEELGPRPEIDTKNKTKTIIIQFNKDIDASYVLASINEFIDINEARPEHVKISISNFRMGNALYIKYIETDEQRDKRVALEKEELSRWEEKKKDIEAKQKVEKMKDASYEEILKEIARLKDQMIALKTYLNTPIPTGWKQCETHILTLDEIPALNNDPLKYDHSSNCLHETLQERFDKNSPTMLSCPCIKCSPSC